MNNFFFPDTMETKCLHGDNIVAHLRNSLRNGLGIGFTIGCLIFLICWFVYKCLYLPSKRSHEIATANGAASVGLELGAKKRQALRPPQKKIEPQRSNSSTTSCIEERNEDQLGVQRFPIPGEPTQLGRNRDSPSTYENTDDVRSLPDEHKYINCNDSNSYQQRNNEQIYANMGVDGNEEYEYVDPSCVQGSFSNYCATGHGYLFMGNVPHQS